MVAGLALAALTSGSGCSTYACLNGLQNASQLTMQLGGHFAGLIFSVKQEKEADYLAAHILKLAGYDLDKARMMLVKFGARSDEESTSFMNSHPAPPERLASYDKTVALIQTDSDGLPGQDPLEDYRRENAASLPSEDTESDGFDSTKCRIYLPNDNICIH